MQPDELEPARSERLVRGNVSPLAAVAAARQLHELDMRRSAAHENFVARFEAQAKGQQHPAAVHGKASEENSSTAVPVAEGCKQASGSGSKHIEPRSWSEGGNLRAEFLSVLPDDFFIDDTACTSRSTVPVSSANTRLDRQQHELSAERVGISAAGKSIPNKERGLGAQSNREHVSSCLADSGLCERVALAESMEQPNTGTAPGRQATFSTVGPVSAGAVAGPHTGSVCLPDQQNSPAAPLAWIPESGAVPRQPALLSIHQKLQKSKLTPQSFLLALPPDKELGEGWTVADEVELAAASQESMDRFGELNTRLYDR